jgi:tRNA-splicing ligase RtcB
MNSDGLVFASDRLAEVLRSDPCLQQVANVAHLPGIVGPSMAMPDIHWGYGFPIGGVAAFDMSSGVVSPGGVGFDINCGVRLLRTDLEVDEVQARMTDLLDVLYNNVPCGVGAKRSDVRVKAAEMRRLLKKGAAWCVEQGFGSERDLEYIESRGQLDGAQPEQLSKRAMSRGQPQLGTLGSGNHFLEIGHIDRVYDDEAARVMGLWEGGITFMIHTGSRGLGYQVCDDSLPEMLEASRRYGIDLPDPQLCSAPLDSEEGRRYMGGMTAAANYAFANRQLITDRVRRSVESVLRVGPADHGIEIVYDVAHNIAKLETHTIDGQKRRVCVHRKGATRAFPPGHPEIPEAYRDIGQPVLVPGDMGRYSFVLVGTESGFRESYGSSCHGAGRRMSRRGAKRAAKNRNIIAELKAKGIGIRAASMATVNEEMPDAYKDVADVVDVVHNAGLGKRVARIRPIGVVKG